MLGEEALTKACRVLLAPTVNLHRSPLAGRNFECYSEDPLLSGKTAAAFVRGVQSQGVVTTVKHFAGNDAEFERHTINSVIDDRALRELYLVPFELAVREGGALGVMTAYNRLNGPHCSEHRELITGILRGEWGFEGFVLTDWLSAGSTLGSSAAGLDLEMPGPARFYGAVLAEAVRDGEIDEAVVDAQVGHLLGVFARVGALDDPPDWSSTSVDRPEHRVLAREAATSSMVLLKNDAVLPFDVASLRTVAVLGPNAGRPQMMGGGSANLAPHYRISPLEALRARLGDAVDVRFERAVDIDQAAAPIQAEFTVEYFAGREFGDEAVTTRTLVGGRLLLIDTPPPGIDISNFSFRASSRYVPDETGPHTLTLVQIGGWGRVLVDGVVVLDGDGRSPRARHRVLRDGQRRARGDGRNGRRDRPSTSWSSSPSATGSSCAGSSSATGSRRRRTCSTVRWRPRPRPTRWCWWSAPTTTGRARGTTAPPWTSRVARTNWWRGSSPPTATRWSWSTPARR